MKIRFVFTLFTFLLASCGSHIVYKAAQQDYQDSLNEKFYSSDPLENHESSLKIIVVDVGQGDATLLIGPLVDDERISILIDAGGLDPDGGAIIQDILEDQGIEKLNYVVLTHYDGDHMGGFVNVAGTRSLLWDYACVPKSNFPQNAIIDLGMTSKVTESVEEFSDCRDKNLSSLSEGHIVIGEEPHQNIGYEIDLNEGYSVRIVAGNGYVIDQEERVKDVDTDNEKSIAVLLSHADGFGFLVTGDLTGQPFGNEDALVEKALGDALVARGETVTVLRAGHHGSDNASSEDFLRLLEPEVSIISVGGNSHGHPSCGALGRLVEYSGEVYLTGGEVDEECEVEVEVGIVGGSIVILLEEAKYEIFNYYGEKL